MLLIKSLQERRALARARALVRAGEYDDALDALDASEGDDAQSIRTEARREAARHWLDKASDAADAHDGRALKRHWARAGRYRFDSIDHWFRDIDRRVRREQVALTSADHWVELVNTAEVQRVRWQSLDDPSLASVPAWGSRARLAMLRRATAEWEVGDTSISPEDLDRATPQALTQVLPHLQSGYPDDLAEGVYRLGPEFARAVLLMCVGRPDLAALPLVELAESEPLVCFERARVAHALGLPRTALLALQGFALRAGGHTRIRRLHTAVFAAQSALACGERGHALELLLQHVPVRQLGGRPLMLTATLMAESGQAREAQTLLGDHLSRHPDDGGARTLLTRLEAAAHAPPPCPDARNR